MGDPLRERRASGNTRKIGRMVGWEGGINSFGNSEINEKFNQKIGIIIDKFDEKIEINEKFEQKIVIIEKIE